MQFSFSASGAPAAVRDSINSQAKAASRGAGWPVAASVRDYVNAELRDAPADASVSVKVDVSVNLTGLPKKAVIGAVTTAAGTTEIIDASTGVTESTVGDVAIGDGVQVGAGSPPAKPIVNRRKSP